MVVMSVASERLIPHGEPPAYFTFPGLTAAGLAHATTTRHCPGVASPPAPMAPLETGAAPVLARAGLDLGRMVWAKQIHGAAVVEATAAGGFAGVGDAIITRARAVPLAIFTADCLAITLWDPEAPTLGVVHAGWRGTAAGVVTAAVAALERLGGRPERLRAAIAPSIGPCCYEVDTPVVDAFVHAYAERCHQWFTPTRPRHFRLDLWTANESLLVEAGVNPAHVESPRVCTACHPDLLFSYRKRDRGRLVTLAAL
jgi:purine-nucleoside/S-methyl-5'-thioadenosine phosphorylase / adenosine deaminase